MAVIGTIRKQSGLLVIIVGVALAAFVLGDFLKPRSGRRIVNIAEVMGEDIPYSQFDDKFQQNLEAQKNNQKKESLSSEEIFQLKDQTYNQIVQKIILQDQYDDLGLVVSPQELIDQIQGEKPHAYILQYFKDPKTQQYDPKLVRNYISQLDQMKPEARTQWDEFVQAIKEDRIRTKYKDLISQGYFMPDTFVVNDFYEKKTTAKIRLVGVRNTTIPDSAVTVTDKDLEKYYEEYKQNYDQEASRDLDYVVFDVKPSISDRKEIRDDVFKIFEDFKTVENIPLFVNSESDNRYDSTWHKQGELPARIDSVVFNAEPGAMVKPYIENDAWHMARLVDVQYRPDSMKASHILLTFKGAFRAPDSITRSKEEAQHLADSLLKIIKKSPSKLGDLAKEFSDDPSVNQNSGDLGWFADGSMVYPFNHAVYTHKIGDVTMIQSQFGFHIIEVTGKKEAVKKVRVAQIDVAITPSQDTYENVYTLASEFQGKATSMEAFDTLATSMGLSKRTASYLQPMSNRIAGLDYPRPIIQWAYTDGIGVGSISHVFTLEDKYVVAMVTKVREKGIPSLEDIRENIEPLVRNELKGDMVYQKLQDAVKETTDLQALAEKFDTKVDTVDNLNFTIRNVAGFGNEPNVAAKAFTMKPGDFSGPIKGNNAAFVFVLDDITKPGPDDDDMIYQRQMLMNFKAKVNNNSFIQTLEKESDVVDNRVRFY